MPKFHVTSIIHPKREGKSDEYLGPRLRISEFEQAAKLLKGKRVLIEHDPQKESGYIVDAYVHPETGDLMGELSLDLNTPYGKEAAELVKSGKMMSVSFGQQGTGIFENDFCKGIACLTPYEVSIVSSPAIDGSIIQSFHQEEEVDPTHHHLYP